MKYLRTLALAVVLLELALPAHLPAAEVTPATDETTISTQKPALGYPSKKLLPSQHQPTTTVYPAGTTSSARGGDTILLSPGDFCGTNPGDILCTGTDGKVSSTVLPTSVVTSTATGTDTTNVIPKFDGAGGLGPSQIFEDGSAAEVRLSKLRLAASGELVSGLATEVSGQLLDYGINYAPLTTRNTGYIGALFALDVRDA